MTTARTDAAGGALALLSGGLDSAVAAALHQRAGSPIALGLFVDYSQRAAVREQAAARALGEALGFAVRTTTLPLLAEVTRTALVRPDAALPRPDPDALDRDAERTADAVWVPNRNALLVNLAAALAEAAQALAVFIEFL